jgi:serine/threonine protein kinase
MSDDMHQQDYWASSQGDTQPRHRPTRKKIEKVIPTAQNELYTREGISKRWRFIPDDGQYKGREIGTFFLHDPNIGKGGQGYVYQAQIQWDPGVEPYFPHKTFAVKIITDREAHKREEEIGYFNHADGSIGFPGFPTLLDIGNWNPPKGNQFQGTPFLSLVYPRLHPHMYSGVKKHNMSRIKKGRDPTEHVDLEDAVTTFAALLQGLIPLHKEGYIMIDIDPGNVMIDYGEAQIDDKEIHRRLGRDHWKPFWIDPGCAHRLKQLHTIRGKKFIGKTAYFAPESVQHKNGEVVAGDYSKKSDIFSTTLVFATYLSGIEPYMHYDGIKRLYREGDGAAWQDAILRTRARDGEHPVDFGQISQHHSNDFRKIQRVLKAGLTLDPHKRPNAQQLLEMVVDEFGMQEITNWGHAPIHLPFRIPGGRKRPTTSTYKRTSLLETIELDEATFDTPRVPKLAPRTRPSTRRQPRQGSGRLGQQNTPRPSPRVSPRPPSKRMPQQAPPQVRKPAEPTPRDLQSGAHKTSPPPNGRPKPKPTDGIRRRRPGPRRSTKKFNHGGSEFTDENPLSN